LLVNIKSRTDPIFFTFVFEAMASGLPVIASGIEPMTDYLKDEENAILVSPMDYKALAQQIIRVLEKTALQDRLIIN